MQVAGKQFEKILTGLAGEYHVAAELCRRDFFASLTLKNYPKVDIFVMHPAEQYAVPIQVKTVARGKGKWGFFVPPTTRACSSSCSWVTMSTPMRRLS